MKWSSVQCATWWLQQDCVLHLKFEKGEFCEYKIETMGWLRLVGSIKPVNRKIEKSLKFLKIGRQNRQTATAISAVVPDEQAHSRVHSYKHNRTRTFIHT